MRKYIYIVVIAIVLAASVQAQDARSPRPTQAGYQFAINRTALVGVRMNQVLQAQYSAEMQRREVLNQKRWQQRGLRYDPNQPTLPWVYW